MRKLSTLLNVLAWIFCIHQISSGQTFMRTIGTAGDENAYNLQKTSDGGFIVAGTTNGLGAGGNDVLLIKLDDAGVVQWARTVGGPGLDYALFVGQTSEGGYIVTGVTDAFAGFGQLLLAKLDSAGGFLWASSLGAVGNGGAGQSVMQTKDDGYIVTGYPAGAIGGLGLFKYDSNGQLQWFRRGEGVNFYGNSVQQTSDGGYIVAGAKQGGFGVYDLSLLKFDAAGNLEWAQQGGGVDFDAAASVQQTLDGGYIVAGATASFGAGGQDVLLSKYSSSGTLEWARTVGGGGDDGADFVLQTADQNYIVSGHSASFGNNTGAILLLKFDAAGSLKWAKTGPAYSGGSSVQATADGGYLVAASTSEFGAGGSDILLIKTDANGDVGGCAEWSDVSPTVGDYFYSAATSYSIDSPAPTTGAGTLDSRAASLTATDHCDRTAPVITPEIDGALGLGNWYVGNVSVAWHVVDNESGISSSSGCDPLSLTANTAGTTLTCSATNGAGLSASAQVTLKIDQSPPNPPSASLSPAPNGSGWNNSATMVAFAPNGDVGPSGIAGCTSPIVVNYETNGALQSGLCSDAAGNNSSATVVTVKIDEEAPIVSNVLASQNPVAIGTGTAISAGVTDPGQVVSLVASAQYNINGGPFGAMAGSFNQASVNVSATTPPFTATGVYSVCVTGADLAGNTSAAACIPLPVYDPAGGFVTGGGIVSSSAGSDLANPNASGLATFGFVSKYVQGSTTPSGNLQFHFDAGNLHFQSTSMEWLVVTSEPRAQFKGNGTINGGISCQYQADSWDNSFQPGNQDAFGIKIYSCAGGGDRYNLGATPLTNGSIIIHEQ